MFCFVNQCKTNINTYGNNDKLKLKCNMCDNPTPDIYNTNILSSGTLVQQGSYPFGLIDPNNRRKFAAGNEFTGTFDMSNPLEPYYKESTSSTDYKYYHHTDFEAIPVPTSSHITPLSIGLAKIDNVSSCKNPFILHHDDIIVIDIQLPDFNPVSTMSMLDNASDELGFEYNNLMLLLDKGNTEQLLADIYNRAPQGKLKDDLIYCSPLSDTVITALLIEYPLSHGNFKTVMQRNLPVSNAVSPYLNERLKTLPPGIVRQLEPLMAYNPAYVTPASLRGTIDFLELEKQLYINKAVYLLTDTVLNDKQAAIELLMLNNTTAANQDLFATYLHDGNYTMADSILSAMDTTEQKTADWATLSRILLSLYGNGKTLYDMDSTQTVFVRELAYKCPAELGTANARSILYLLYGEEVPECVEIETRDSRIMLKDIEFVSPDSDAYMEDNFPDPFRDNTLVNYYLPAEMEGEIIINDMYGRNIAVYELEPGENTLEIISEGWAPGVYTYTMFADAKLIEVKKMVITQ